MMLRKKVEGLVQTEMLTVYGVAGGRVAVKC